ncbi:MAG TPA: hypothetical protein VGK17_07995 [Propionicimonas sp.]|jgi:hypothetical protein
MPEWGGRPLGNLRLTGVDGPQGGDGGLRLSVEYQPPADDLGPRRLVALVPSIASAWPTRRTYGRVQMLPDPPGQVGPLGPRSSTHAWVWSLAADEVELIEAERVPNAGAERVVFNLDVRGIAVVAEGTYGFAGDTQFSVATADWLALLRLLDYGVAPSLRGLAGDSMTLEASWGLAEQKLRDARRHLALGDDREALRTAYIIFDAMAANPFRSTWEAVLGDPALPAEKADVLRALLQAEASVLNKLGRHPAWELTDGADRQMLPLDHWEAELAIALAQLLLAAAFRWRSTKGAHELELPTTLPQGVQPEA